MVDSAWLHPAGAPPNWAVPPLQLLKHPQGLPWVLAKVPSAGDLSKTQFWPSPELMFCESPCLLDNRCSLNVC